MDCTCNLTGDSDVTLFVVVLYALSAVYFAGVMVRLMLTLTPVVCVLSGIAFSRLLELYLKEEDNPQATDTDSEDEGSGERNNRNMYDKVHVTYQYICGSSVNEKSNLVLMYDCKHVLLRENGSCL